MDTVVTDYATATVIDAGRLRMRWELPFPHHIIRTAGHAAGLEVFPHALRRTFATNLVRGGTDLAIVAEPMGHTRTETTRMYTLTTEEQVQDAVDNATVDYWPAPNP